MIETPPLFGPRPRWAATLPSLALVASSALLLSAQTAPRPPLPLPPPPAPVRPVTNHHFGVEVVDPYHWMEDWKSAEFRGWLKSENDFARATLDAIPVRQKLLDELRRLDASLDLFPSALNPVGRRLFYMQTPPPTDVFQLFVRDGTDGRERRIFDPRTLPSPDGSHVSLDLYHAAPDGEHVVCRVSRGGSEETTLYVIATETGRTIGQPLERSESGNANWHPNGRAFFYKRRPFPGEPVADASASEKRLVYLHSLGSDPKSDRPVFGPGLSADVPMTDRHSASIQTSWDSEYVVGIVHEGVAPHREVYVAPLSTLDRPRIPWRKVCDVADEVFDCALQGNSVLLFSHRGAPGGKLLRVACDNPDVARAEVVLPESDAVLRQVAVARDALYVVLREGIAPRLLRIEPGTDSRAEEIPLPLPGSVERILRDPREPGILVALSSWTEPTAYHAFDPKARRWTPFRMGPAEAPGRVALQIEQTRVRSKDGTSVPLTIVSPRERATDGRRPTLLAGYGAYGISQTPNYDLGRNPWFAAGGVYAVAHVRGGGELGDAWRRAGKGANKQNGIDDFVACAEYLVARGYTSHEKLAATGTSAGGVLVGRALTQRPDLFRAVVLEVGALDALRFEATRNGPPNVPEWGSVETRPGFEALRAMSPYEHVVPGTAYPAVLLTAGWNDPRVDVWQPAKMAARLRAGTSSGRPILLSVNYDEGHFHTTLSSYHAHHADLWAFLLRQLDEIP